MESKLQKENKNTRVFTTGQWNWFDIQDKSLHSKDSILHRCKKSLSSICNRANQNKNFYLFVHLTSQVNNILIQQFSSFQKCHQHSANKGMNVLTTKSTK
jgi:hypothetical protein